MPKSESRKGESPEAQLAGFLSKFTPRIATLARAAIDEMHSRYPTAVQMVYDNYNALAIGFGPSEKTSLAVFSIAVYPRWVSLFFLQGASLADPQKVLKGSGNLVRYLVLKSADDLDLPAVTELMAAALKNAKQDFEPDGSGQLIIKSVSAKQRPRRPPT